MIRCYQITEVVKYRYSKHPNTHVWIICAQLRARCFSYINVNTCELSFRPLFCAILPALAGGGGFGRVYRVWSNITLPYS
jgi:hypothetical protein